MGSNTQVSFESIWTFLVLLFFGLCLGEEQPNIVFIVADDLGWNDVGFHGSNQIPTPNLDALAYNGIILNSHYVQSTGTSSRAALFTGKYPMRHGMHGPSIQPADKRALPEAKLLPEYFKSRYPFRQVIIISSTSNTLFSSVLSIMEVLQKMITVLSKRARRVHQITDMGYATHLVGKWDLGYAKWNQTPTFRGFDHHFGFYNTFTSYFDYLTTWTYDDKDYTGFNLWKNGIPAFEESGKYATDAFTDHAVKTIEDHDVAKPLLLMISHLAVHTANRGKYLEAPQEAINNFRHIPDANRRTYAAMVSKLDNSVGAIVDALANKNMLHNSIVVFISDNGAPTTGPGDRNWGSNYPLRGSKDTLFEGGIRSAAFIYSPLLVQASRVSTDLIHITDWLPTLFTAANGDLGLIDPELDGIDQWSSLVYDLPSARNDVLINIDEKTRNAALRFYNWKLIVGTSHNGTYNDYYGHIVINNIEEIPYNTSAISDSLAGRAVGKVSYTPVNEIEYSGLRRTATVKCLDEKAKKNPCDPASGSLCLYDIPSDPCEENDLAKFFSSVVRRMKRALVDYRKGLVPQQEEDIDIEGADPKLFKFTWNPWTECRNPDCQIPS